MTKKVIKKDKRYQEYAAKQTERLMQVPRSNNSNEPEETKKEKWTDIMARIFE